MTRHNIAQLDAFEALADAYGAQLRLTRLRPSGRGADTWDELHPTAEQQVELYRWLLDRPRRADRRLVLPPLRARASPLPGLNLCGAGRVVCLIDPVGDVYACPFVLHDEFQAGSVREPGGFGEVWRESQLFRSLRQPDVGGGVRVVRLLRRLPGRLHGGQVLHRPAARRPRPRMRARATAKLALAGVAPPVPSAVARAGPLGAVSARPRPAGSTGPAARVTWRRMRLLDHSGRLAADRPQPGRVRARTRPTWAGAGRSRTATSPTTGAGRPAGPGVDRHRGGVGPPERLALRALPAGGRVRATGWAAVAAACHAEGALVLAAARPRRRAGVERLQPGAAVGAVAGARGQQPRSARSGWRSPTSPRSSPGSRCRARLVAGPGSTGSRSTPASTACAPVPVRPHQPARRRVGQDRLALRARRSSDAVRARVGPTASSGCGCRATSWRRGPASCPRRPPTSPPRWPSCVDYITVVRGVDLHGVGHPARRPRAARVQPRPGSPAPGRGSRPAWPWWPRARSSTPARPSGPLERRHVRRGRDDPGPDRRPRPGRQAGRRGPARPRPCILCNQACQVRDARNPIVSCVVEPATGHEDEDPPRRRPASRPAGRRCWSSAAASPASSAPGWRADRAGHRVAAGRARRRRRRALSGRRPPAPGGSGSALAGVAGGRVPAAGRHHRDRAGGRRRRDRAFDGTVVLCTGSVAGPRDYEVDGRRHGPRRPPRCSGGPSPAGRARSPCGTRSAARSASRSPSCCAGRPGHEVVLVTPDLIAGNELSRSGDLAPANVRLLGAGVAIEKRSILRRVRTRRGGRRGPLHRRAADAGRPTRGRRRLPPARRPAVAGRPASACPGPGTRSRPAPSSRRSSKAAGGPWSWCRRPSGGAAGMSRYRYLFSPLRLGPVVVRQPHRVLRPPHQLRRGRPAERAARRLLRGPGRRRRRADHHRGALDPPDRLAVREADPRLPPRGHPRLPAHHRRRAPPRHADLRPDQPQRRPGSGMYSRLPVWAPSPVADPLFREVPKEVDRRGDRRDRRRLRPGGRALQGGRLRRHRAAVLAQLDRARLPLAGHEHAHRRLRRIARATGPGCCSRSSPPSARPSGPSWPSACGCAATS